MSSAYGTKEGGSRERMPVAGGLYCTGVAADVRIPGCCVVEAWEVAVMFPKRVGNWNRDLMLEAVEEARRGRGELFTRCDGEKNRNR